MSYRFSVAPMLDWTTPACRRLHRLLAPRALLYSEMISTGAIIHGDRNRHLAHDGDHPCALQLGGGDPAELARATALAAPYGYVEINLNAGCPSDRVQHNQIGAVLMKEPRRLADCLTAMAAASPVPISLKHRLGVDEQDEGEIFDFIATLVEHSPCRKFIVHARKAWLKGLSPAENRTVPPLNYGLVFEIKRRFPGLEIVLNGGLEDIDGCARVLAAVDGVMVGRAAYQRPEMLLAVPRLHQEEALRLEDVLPRITALLESRLAAGESLFSYGRHLLGLGTGRPGARRFRQLLSEDGRRAGAGLEVWTGALAALGYHAY